MTGSFAACLAFEVRGEFGGVWKVKKVSRLIAFALLLPVASAGELSKETLKAWDDYVRAANSCMMARLRPDQPFLWLDQHPQFFPQVHAGHIVVTPMTDPNPKHVPNGLIHHWIGAVFLPGAHLDDVFSVIRDYDHYRDFYPAAVLASRALGQDGAGDLFSLLMISRAALARTAFMSDDQANYIEVDPHRWYSISYTTRVQEIEDYGDSDQHTLPPDQGHGYIWRLYSIARYEQRDGGVYLEMEAMALSRDVPVAVRWLVDPIVRQLARGSMVTTLRRTEDAVGALCAAAHTSAQATGQR